jgi:hypothetical protein
VLPERFDRAFGLAARSADDGGGDGSEPGDGPDAGGGGDEEPEPESQPEPAVSIGGDRRRVSINLLEDEEVPPTPSLRLDEDRQSDVSMPATPRSIAGRRHFIDLSQEDEASATPLNSQELLSPGGQYYFEGSFSPLSPLPCPNPPRRVTVINDGCDSPWPDED